MALENILSQEIIQKLGWTLLHFIWQAAAVALLLTILLAILRKAAANVRYIVACAALGLIVLLPIVTIQLVPVSTPQPIAGIEPAPAPVILPVQKVREIPAVEMTVTEGPVQHEITGTAYNASWKQRAAEKLEPALPYIVAGWLLGVFGLSLWHLGGWAQLQRLRKKMVRQVDESLYAKLRRLSERLRVKQVVQLAESALVQVPTVVGWLRPVILLPASALTGLSSEQLEALLAHELAHIRRYDYLFNMLQAVVETLGFYHPAVWWVSHKIRLERENCCDDLAVSISGDRVSYARALTSMEEIRAGRNELAVAATGGNLFERIRRLVGKDSTESSRTSWIPSMITILLIAIIAIPTTLALTIKSESAEPEQLNEILEKFSDGTSADESGNKSKSVRESVEKYIAAALAGEDEKAAEYAYPGTAVAAQTNDMREILQGQDIKIIGASIGEWNSLAISSVIQADHGRIGSVVFHLKKMVLDQNIHWLIDDIDLETLDTIGKQIQYFINNVPDAKTIIINADTYTNKQADAKVESEEGRIEGRIIDINTGKGISGVQLAAVPDSSPASNERFACTSAEDGSFAIGGLQSGEYLLQGDFPSVDVDVVSGRSTKDILIGVRRGETVPAPKETTAEQQGGGQILIGMRVIEMSADAMKDVFEPNESLSSELLVRQGHEIAGRLLTLMQEREDAKLMAAPQMLLNNNSNGTIAMIKEEFFVLNYEPIEGEPGKFAPQIQPLEVGWEFNIKAEILEGGEKVHIELATRQQEPGFETRQYRPGYDYQIPIRPEIFVIDTIAKNGEPFIISRLKPGEQALCLIVTASVILPERQPEPLLGKKLPEPDNIQNIDDFKLVEGKPTLICFWDMNQRPSRNLVSELARREKGLAEKNVTVYLVHTSNIEPAKLKEWLDNQNIAFTCGSIERDAEKVLFRWGVRAQPWLILTDEEGVVRAEGFNIEQLDEKLRAKSSDLSLEEEEVIQNPEGQTNIEYRGFVRNEKGDPIAGAKICWFSKQSGGLSLNLSEQWNHPDVLTTDKRGEFILHNVYGNNIGIYVKAEGYAQRMIGPLVLPRIIGPLFLPGDSKKLMQIVLQPGADVFGKVVEDGQNVVGARISAHVFSEQLHKMLDSPWPCLTTKTDENGFYRLVDLPAGQFSIGVNSATAKGNLNMAQKKINLEPGDRTELNFGDEEGFTLTGVVTVDGEAVEIAKVMIQLPNGSTKWGWTDRNGNFQITGIPSGRYQLFTMYDKDLDPVTFTWGKDGKQDYKPRFDRRQITIENDLSVDINLEEQRSRDILPAEESVINNSRDPMLIKSAAPSSVDKSIVKVDLSVVEVSSDSKMDSKTIAEIKNLLGGKIAVPASPDVADLLRDTAGATAAVKDESAGDKRVTQEQFKTLFDLLASRGYIKILMNPTLEVVDGQTAKILSSQKVPLDKATLPPTQSDNKETKTEYEDVTDSIQITPNVSKDGNIILLQIEAALSSQTIPHGKEQKPIVNRHEIVTMIRLSPGESGIIGGLKQIGLLTEPGNAVKDLEVPATEMLVILTPTIVASAEPKEPMETVNFQNAEAKTVIEKLAAWTGKTIIPPADLMKQKITIYSPEQMPRSEAAAMILNSLRSKGYTAEQTDDTILLKPAKEEQPGTDKDKIQIDTRILTVDEDFLNDVGLDANSISDANAISDPNAWPEPAPVVLAPPDNLGTYRLILDDLQVAFLLKATQAHKDAKMLTSPRVTVRDAEKAEIFTGQEIPYVSDYNEPNSPSEELTPKIEKLKTGTSIWLKPHLTPDKKKIHIEFELEICELQGVEEHKYMEKYPYQIPQVSVITTRTSCMIPDGKTLLIGGLKITEEVERVSRTPWLGDLPLIGRLFSNPGTIKKQRMLLILVKPTIDPHQNILMIK